jgi:hypothetical protein
MKCTSCGRDKGESEFHISSARRRGRACHCRACVRRSRDNDTYRDKMKLRARKTLNELRYDEPTRSRGSRALQRFISFAG